MSNEDQSPEEMRSFFDKRANTYDNHMRENVVGFQGLYQSVAEAIEPTKDLVKILDLGCGTGLELDHIFKRAPRARVTCVDLSENMLGHLVAKYPLQKDRLELVHGSYLALEFGERTYDYVVAVMTLHHLLPDTKRLLYERVRMALVPGGTFASGEYVVSLEEEQALLEKYHARFEGTDILDSGAYHVDIPFSTTTEIRLLREAGLVNVRVTWSEAAAAVLVAARPV